jgi:hypothetical protein
MTGPTCLFTILRLLAKASELYRKATAWNSILLRVRKDRRPRKLYRRCLRSELLNALMRDNFSDKLFGPFIRRTRRFASAPQVVKTGRRTPADRAFILTASVMDVGRDFDANHRFFVKRRHGNAITHLGNSLLAGPSEEWLKID